MNIIVACDNNFGQSVDTQCVNTFCEKLRAAGHTASNVGRGPNKTQEYSRSHQCDVMVQIAAGKCIGTFADFVVGIKRGYYKAKKFSIPYWKNEESVLTWKAKRAWDDHFSYSLDMSSYLGKTLPECYKQHPDIAIFSHGNTAEEMATMFLNGLGGNTNAGNTGATTTGGGGNTAFDLIKQVVTPWDKYGVQLGLDGNTLTVTRATTKNAPILHENIIVNDSIQITDYANNTPNYISDGKNTLKNDFLISRFGKIEPDEKPENKGKVWLQDMYQIAQRESGHSIDMKVLFDPELHEGMYVHLQIPSLEIDGYYFISKTSMEDEVSMSITLDTAPPSRYQETTETTITNGSTQGTTKDPVAIGNALAAKYGFCSKVVCPAGGSPTESYAEMKRTGRGSCFAWSDALYTELNAAGIKARIIQYATSLAGNHRSVQINTNGTWEDYPYRSTNISKYARNTTNKAGMFVYKNAP